MILNKATRLLLTISVSLISFSTSSAWIDLGSHDGIRSMGDTRYIPINIIGYEQYKEINIKMKAFEKTYNFQSGEHAEIIFWVDCKNQKYITKAISVFNRDNSFKGIIQVGDRPKSLLSKSEEYNPITYLCKNSVLLKRHPSLTRDSTDSIVLMNQRQEAFGTVNQTAPQMSQIEYRQVIQNMDKKIAKLSSHRSRLHPSRDPENPDILRQDTPANRLSINKKELELTCQKIKILKEQERLVVEQNVSKQSDLVPITYTLKSERIRVQNLVDLIRSKGVKANFCY